MQIIENYLNLLQQYTYMLFTEFKWHKKVGLSSITLSENYIYLICTNVMLLYQKHNTNTIKTYKAPLYKTGQERYKSTVSGYMHEQKVHF